MRPRLQKALTDKFLKSAKPPTTGRLEIRDLACRGLVLRITAAGARSWSFRYRHGGRVSRATVGPYPDIGLAMARKAADAMRALVAAGGNPAEDKRRARVEGNARSFGHLAERYLVEHARRHKRSYAKDEQYLRLHILPQWRNRNYTKIGRADVIELIERLIAADKLTTANRVHSVVNTIFSFALDASLIEAHPSYRLRKRAPERARSRTLTDTEIRLFWHGIVKSDASIHSLRIGLALRLALLTGTRIGEVAGIRRAELENIESAQGASWSIPGSRTKNGRDHMIPLAPLARGTILELLALIGPEDEYLLPTRSRRRIGPMHANSLTDAMANFGQDNLSNNEAATWKAERPTPHDLRRTVETRMAGLGIPQEIRDRVLNHVTAGVGSKHYNRHDYAAEKRDALLRWSLATQAILDPKPATVVSIAKARRR